jgi:hypothetical protein
MLSLMLLSEPEFTEFLEFTEFVTRNTLCSIVTNDIVLKKSIFAEKRCVYAVFISP